jgi:hypothetical protein
MDGLSKLRNVLVAYSWKNTRVGYCQSMNYLCALLLLIMEEEEAFWFLSILVCATLYTHTLSLSGCLYH